MIALLFIAIIVYFLLSYIIGSSIDFFNGSEMRKFKRKMEEEEMRRLREGGSDEQD